MQHQAKQILFDTILIAVVLTFMFIRLHFHCIVQRRKESLHIASDVLAVLSVAAAIPCAAIDIWMQIMWIKVDQHPEISKSLMLPVPTVDLERTLKAMFYYAFGHMITLWSVKAAFLCAYFSAVRLGGKLRIMMWVTVVVNAGTFIALALIELLWCRPFNRYWSTDLLMVCLPMDNRRRGAIAFCLHVVTDVLIITTGLAVVHKLQLGRRERLASMFIACLGVVVMGCSTARLIYQQRFATSAEEFDVEGALRNFRNAYRSSAIEVTVAMVALCTPSCRAMLRENRWVGMGSSVTGGKDTGTSWTGLTSSGAGTRSRLTQDEDLEMLRIMRDSQEREMLHMEMSSQDEITAVQNSMPRNPILGSVNPARSRRTESIIIEGTTFTIENGPYR